MSSAEALRRCPEAVFLRPRHALYRQYSQAVWSAVEEVVPRVERTGMDEGYLDLGTVLDSFAGARRLAEAVQVAVRGATSLSCSLGVSTSKVVCKIASDRRKPGGITVVPPGREARFLAPLPTRVLPGVGPRAGGAARGGGHRHDRRARRRSTTSSCGRCCPARSGGSCATARGGSTRATSSSTCERISISTEETFERDLSDRSALHAELRRMADDVASYLRRDGLSARTVTTKLRYTDFSIRSRSTTLPTPIDEAGADRRARVRSSRPGPPRPPGSAPPRRRRRLGADGRAPADARRALTQPPKTAGRIGPRRQAPKTRVRRARPRS